MASPRKKATPKTPRGAAPALKLPREGDGTALVDLRLQRDLLRTRLKSRKISPRDLATVSAELRKVNATISAVEGVKSTGGIAEEELSARAQQVRELLMKTKAERDRLRLVPVPESVPEERDALKAATR